MLSAIASSILLLAGTGLAVYMLLLRAAADRAEAREMKSEIDNKLAALHELTRMARREAERLEAAIRNAQALELESPRDSLDSLESLADPSSLANPDALRHATAHLPHLPSNVAGDVFDSDQKTLAIARLKDQGNSAGEIAHRLGLPLGEVELRLSMRAA
jgi:DNA-binding NarL/FixJ family response regulator